MKYLGGKSRIAKQISSYLNKVIEDNKIERYIEPFCGACWITQEINPNIIRVACDIHPDLILMWQELTKGWIPPENISEEEYKDLKSAPSSALRGFVGFGSSFGGKFFGGYARSYNKEGKLSRNHCKEARNSLLKKVDKIKNVHFKNCSYLDIPIDKLENRLIYCDIPYLGTTAYSNTKPFNHEEFYKWARQVSLNNHVYISEYQMPPDFEVVLEIPIKVDMQMKNGKENRVEKLFKYKG